MKNSPEKGQSQPNNDRQDANRQDAGRQARLAEALRANLHRRKSQARARSGTDLAASARKEQIKNGQA